MQILAIMFFFSVLVLAIGSMRALLIEHSDKIGHALAGDRRFAGYQTTGVILPFRQAVGPVSHQGLRAAA